MTAKNGTEREKMEFKLQHGERGAPKRASS